MRRLDINPHNRSPPEFPGPPDDTPHGWEHKNARETFKTMAWYGASTIWTRCVPSKQSPFPSLRSTQGRSPPVTRPGSPIFQDQLNPEGSYCRRPPSPTGQTGRLATKGLQRGNRRITQTPYPSHISLSPPLISFQIERERLAETRRIPPSSNTQNPNAGHPGLPSVPSVGFFHHN